MRAAGFAFIGFIVVALLALPAAAQSTPPLKLVVSAQLGGDVASLACGARRGPTAFAALAAELLGEPDALALDAGDLLGAGAVAQLAADHDPDGLARAVATTGLRALAVGHRDLATPRAIFVKAAHALKSRGVPYVLTNLRCDPEAADLCAAIVDAGDAPLLLDTRFGKIAVLAFTSPATMRSIARDRARGLHLDEPAAVLPHAVDAARARGASFVVTMYDPADDTGADEALPLVEGARAAPDLLIVNELYQGVAALRTTSGVPFAATRAQHAIVVEPGAPELVRPARPPAEIITKEAIAIGDFIRSTEAWLCRSAARPLPGGRLEAPLTRDEFTVLVTDVMRATDQAEIAIINTGAVSRSGALFPLKDAIRAIDLTAGLPFEDVRRTGTLGGAALAALARDAPARGFLVRGVTLDGGKVRVNGRPLDETVRYRFVTTGFVADGGDGGLPDDARLDPTPAPGPRAVLLDWLARTRDGDLRRSIPDPADRARWTFRFSLDGAFTSTDITNPSGYADPQLARSEQTNFRAESETRADADHPGWTAENSLRLRYAINRTIKANNTDTGFTETTDLIAARSTMMQRKIVDPKERRAYDPLPYLDIYIESEFTRPSTRAYHHLELRPTVGARFQLWERLTLNFGAGLDWEALAPGSFPIPVLVAGWTLTPTKLFTVAGRPVEGQTTLDASFRDPGGASDLIIRFSAKLSFPLFSVVSLTLGYDLFARNLGQGGAWGVSSDATIGVKVGLQRAVQTWRR